jgi:pimeloyl-ACP methyl ester carboxylesterase
VWEQGAPDGPTVVLVHGYPDNASVWDGVAGRLGERFRVVRYDVRGHGASGQPASRDGYRLEHLANDLVEVVRATSPARPVHLVGHDWGSVQSWAAVTDPDNAGLFASFTTISGPNLDHLRWWTRQQQRQAGRARQTITRLVRSWYMVAFQVPVVPELVWRLGRLRRRFRADYRDARNGLELYRANMGRRPPGTTRSMPHSTSVPVLQIALTQDRYCPPDLLASAEPWCTRLWRRELAGGHWAIRDHPDSVAGLVAEFVDHINGAPASGELAGARVVVRLR